MSLLQSAQLELAPLLPLLAEVPPLDGTTTAQITLAAIFAGLGVAFGFGVAWSSMRHRQDQLAAALEAQNSAIVKLEAVQTSGDNDLRTSVGRVEAEYRSQLARSERERDRRHDQAFAALSERYHALRSQCQDLEVRVAVLEHSAAHRDGHLTPRPQPAPTGPPRPRRTGPPDGSGG